MSGVVKSINISPGGVPKRPVPTIRIGRAGLEGDGHDNPRHGGPDAAVCLFSLETITRIAGEGHPIAPGSAGENLTIEGLEWARVTPGVRLQIGAVVLEVTRFTTPCQTIRASFREGDVNRIHQARHPGESRVYARVLTEGFVRSGESIAMSEG
jgi:MOSC domain-containing protein YiiM